jgi:hypothetical protein
MRSIVFASTADDRSGKRSLISLAGESGDRRRHESRRVPAHRGRKNGHGQSRLDGRPALDDADNLAQRIPERSYDIGAGKRC